MRVQVLQTIDARYTRTCGSQGAESFVSGLFDNHIASVGIFIKAKL